VRYAETDVPALRGVNYQLPRGARVALVGPNGSGKSTLLRAAAGLLPVDRGEIRIYGNEVGACHHRVAYLPQRSDLDWRFPISLKGLVMTGRYVHLGWLSRPARHDSELVDAVLARLGLEELASRQIGQLSGGQQQRALLARALVQEADLLLLDEPMNAVDVSTRSVFDTVLHDLVAEGKSVVVATHDVGEMDAPFDDGLFLVAGEAVPPPPAAAGWLGIQASAREPE
jgi:manganese/zinc/iron transport system ATP- binding protein